MEVRRVDLEPHVVSVEEGNVARDGVRAFGSLMYGKLAAKKQGNFIFSPYSISSAISLANLGAAGSTRKKIDTVMGYGDREAVRTARALLWLGAGAGKGKLNVANAAWMQSGYAFLDSFVDSLKAVGSELRTLNFRSDQEGSRQTINKWVEEQTKRKILNLLPERSIEPLTRLILTNAIHFKDQWEKPFDEKRTVDDVFRGAGGSCDIKMMNGIGIEGRHMAGPGFEAALLPYSGSASMLIILPDEAQRPGHALIGLEKSIDGDGAFLDGILKGARKAKLKMELPKFGANGDFSLNDALAAIGLGEMFQEGIADFSGMTGDRDLFVSAVVHKAMVDVNERDTEAAAATGMLLKRSAAIMDELRVSMRVDRPFIFAIVSHDAPLFMGRIMDL